MAENEFVLLVLVILITKILQGSVGRMIELLSDATLMQPSQLLKIIITINFNFRKAFTELMQFKENGINHKLMLFGFLHTLLYSSNNSHQLPKYKRNISLNCPTSMYGDTVMHPIELTAISDLLHIFNRSEHFAISTNIL